MQRLALVLVVALALVGCTTEPEWEGELQSGEVTLIDAPEWAIDFKSEPVKTFSCQCGEQTVDLNVDDEWVKAHSPDEIAMVFSLFSFIVSSNALIGADYSDICCAVFRKLKD